MRGSPASSVTCFAAAAGATTGCGYWPGCAGPRPSRCSAGPADPPTVCGSPRTFQLWARRPVV